MFAPSISYTPKSEEMPASILSLGGDIILFHIIPYLSIDDIVSLQAIPNKELQSYLSSTAFYQVLFMNQFGLDNSAPSSTNSVNWKLLYKLRSTLHLYAWGEGERGRLGLYVPVEGRRMRLRFSEPTEVTVLLDSSGYVTPVAVSMGGFSLQVLTGKGNIFRFGIPQISENHNGDYNLVQDQRAINMMDRGLEHYNRFLAQLEAATEIPKEEFYTPAALEEAKSVISGSAYRVSQLELPRTKRTQKVRIVAISSGRYDTIALDLQGQIWAWDSALNIMAVKIGFTTPTGRLLINSENVVTKVVCGWNASSCFITNVGIVVWRNREEMTKEKYPDGTLLALYGAVKGTGVGKGDDKVVDYLLCEGCILFVTVKGLLYKVEFESSDDKIVELNETDPYEVLSFNEFLETKRRKLGEACRFVKITGNFRLFAVFTNKGDVLMGSIRNCTRDKFDYNSRTFKRESAPVIYPELQRAGCINVTEGDYHYLALMKNGDLYSWGLEPRSCGCLGLGKFDDIIAQFGPESVRSEGFDLRVATPKKMNLRGKVCLAISAAGWQSAAIFAKENDD